MRVIGTAGHVDHGKSALVEALTGTHPDRLKEEQEREMTIDLGFAWWHLPDGEEVGVIDVPGHRDFIENMLAGVGGIDAALFVVAADEGVMPQTREHLAILDLLQVPAGVVALTKVDKVDDPAWLDLIQEELRKVLQNTALQNAEIVRVSARTRAGLDALQAALSRALAAVPPRRDLGRPRLPVDRVFTISGFGTVVTGTLIGGSLRIGEDMEILPQGLKARVRGLQTHKQQEEVAQLGSRTAVNVSGVEVGQIERGQVLARPGQFQPTRRLDVRFRLLGDVRQPFRHDDEVKFFLGAAEVVARVRLLGTEELKPSESGWLQLELHAPVVAERGDRYILRRPSPGETLGGGEVVDAHPSARHKRFSQAVFDRLEALERGSPVEILHQAIKALSPTTWQAALDKSKIEYSIAQSAMADLVSSGEVVVLSDEGIAALVSDSATWSALQSRALAEVRDYHRANPLRAGMPREELKSRLKLSPEIFNALVRFLANLQTLTEDGPRLRLPDHAIRFTETEQQQIDSLLSGFTAAPFSPPSVKECKQAVGDAVYAALVERGDFVQVSSEVVFRREDYVSMLAQLRELFAQHGTLSAAQVRDHFKASRKYVLALLEHLDERGLTVRQGDVRRWKSG